jgi:hypothetical protein
MEIIDLVIKQLARVYSDTLDIHGVDIPELMAVCLELLAVDGLTPDPLVLNAELLSELTPTQRREVVTRLVAVLVK